jgi:hypothetical protein
VTYSRPASSGPSPSLTQPSFPSSCTVAATGRRSGRRRRRLGHLLVCPPIAAAPRGPGAPVQHAGLHWLRGALWAGGEDGRTRPGGGRALRRRRHADDGQRRAGYGRAPLAAVGRPAVRHLPAGQLRPRRGDLGAARWRATRASTTARRCPTSRTLVTPTCSATPASGARTPPSSGQRGPRPGRSTARRRRGAHRPDVPLLPPFAAGGRSRTRSARRRSRKGRPVRAPARCCTHPSGRSNARKP